MALSDPQTITIAATPNTLPRILTDASAANYSVSDGTVGLVVSHQNGRRKRHQIKVTLNKISPDPLTDVKMQISASAYLVVDEPIVGFTDTELKDLALSVTNWVNAGSAANLLKVLGGES